MPVEGWGVGGGGEEGTRSLGRTALKINTARGDGDGLGHPDHRKHQSHAGDWPIGTAFFYQTHSFTTINLH